jgi:hypothetical protein
MLQTLRQPKWIAATIIVIALAALFVTLGMWQLDRLEHRQALNEVGEERMDQEAIHLQLALEEAGGDIESLQRNPMRRGSSLRFPMVPAVFLASVSPPGMLATVAAMPGTRTWMM